jgi:DNA-binding MarR family transcriptional regulator
VQETGGDLTGWIEFVADAVAVALERAWKRIEAIRGENLSGGEALILTPKQERLLMLLRHSALGINDIMKELRVTTRAGAHHIIKPLVQHKLVARKGGHKTGKYVLL